MAFGWPACTIAIAVLCMLMFLGHGGPFKAMMESHPMAVISRLTYSMFLVHTPVLTLLESKPPSRYTESDQTFVTVGITAMSIMIAMLIHLWVSL